VGRPNTSAIHKTRSRHPRIVARRACHCPGWTVLNLLFGQIDFDVVLFFIHGDQRIRGDQHLPARKPVSCIGDKIANRPVLVIEVEFFDLPYFPVETVQFVTL
jgi:hypothetical protein